MTINNMQKKGITKANLFWIVTGIIIIGVIIIAIFIFKDLSQPTLADKIKALFEDPSWDKVKEVWSKTKTKTYELLGFERGIADFFKDLLTGAIAGGWIVLLYYLANKVFKDTSIKSGWLELIGSSPWKIAPIAVFYFILHQIPLIKTIVQIITLEFLITFKGNFAYFMIRPLIFAFVLGMLPSIIEGYTRYKLRKKYREQLLNVKADKATIAALRGS